MIDWKLPKLVSTWELLSFCGKIEAHSDAV
jgi:hypothetical protein